MGAENRPALKSKARTKNKEMEQEALRRHYMMAGKPVADIDEVMGRLEGQGRRRSDEPLTEGGGTYKQPTVKVKIKGQTNPNQRFEAPVKTGYTAPPDQRPQGNDSGGGSRYGSETVKVKVKGSDATIKAKIKGGKKKAGGR